MPQLISYKQIMRILNVLVLFVFLLSGQEALSCALCDDNAPLEEKQRLWALDKVLEKQTRADGHRWLKAMPKSIRPLWVKVPWKNHEEWLRESKMRELVQSFQAALEKEFPDIRQRILALYAWYGSGSGYWSGFPSYESLAEEMLRQYSNAELLEAALTESLTESQTEGAARLFAFIRPSDLNLPQNLRAKLLEHSLKTNMRYKRNMAEQAFGLNCNSEN